MVLGFIIHKSWPKYLKIMLYPSIKYYYSIVKQDYFIKLIITITSIILNIDFDLFNLFGLCYQENC